MKTLNLFLKMHFTSLSPDGQAISLAIISEGTEPTDIHGIILREPTDTDKDFERRLRTGRVVGQLPGKEPKSFYAEFQDFDINRCDDWVKENVVSKLESKNDIGHAHLVMIKGNNKIVNGKSELIKNRLTNWLSQFSNYKLNFIVDCGWFTWGKFVELIGEWEETGPGGILMVPEQNFTKEEIEKMINEWNKHNPILYYKSQKTHTSVKIGLPKLPANFPPVPQDLNELIAQKKGISVTEAFELDRELMGLGFYESEVQKSIAKFKEDELRAFGFKGEKISDSKYNALWDAKITKAIWEKML